MIFVTIQTKGSVDVNLLEVFQLPLSSIQLFSLLLGQNVPFVYFYSFLPQALIEFDFLELYLKIRLFCLNSLLKKVTLKG